jgi:hypothetical protein
MAGYSGAPLARKLGIREGQRIAFPAAPEGFDRLLAPLPEVDISPRLRAPLDVIVFFTRRRAELNRRFAALKRALDPAGGLWIAWPKRSSGVDTDLSEDVVREIALANGLVDNKVCAIDATWSGLRLVYRLTDRPPRAARSPGPGARRSS